MDDLPAKALASGPCMVAEAPLELEELALHSGMDGGDLAMDDGADEIMDAELFRDIEHLLDSGHAEIHEAYLAAIDSLSVGGGQLLLDHEYPVGERPVDEYPLVSGAAAWETTRGSMESLSEALSHHPIPQEQEPQQYEGEDVGMTHSGGADDVSMLDDADALFKVREARLEQDLGEPFDGHTCVVPHQRDCELLQREATFLEAQRDFLQYKADAANTNLASLAAHSHGESGGGWEARAEDERRSLEAAQRHQTMLAELLAQHQKSVCALEVSLMQAPITHYVRALSALARCERVVQERRLMWRC
jgi:hypothetical protein